MSGKKSVLPAAVSLEVVRKLFVGPGPNSTVSEVPLESGVIAQLITHPTVRQARGTESPEYANLPRWFFNACERYVENRELIDEPFFCSMLTSDVKGIVQGADDVSQTTLYLMLKYLYNHVPSVSFGSETAVGSWLRGTPREDQGHD